MSNYSGKSIHLWQKGAVNSSFIKLHRSLCHVKICIQNKNHSLCLQSKSRKAQKRFNRSQNIQITKDATFFLRLAVCLYWPIEGTIRGRLLRWEWIRLPSSRSWWPPAGLFVWNTHKENIYKYWAFVKCSRPVCMPVHSTFIPKQIHITEQTLYQQIHAELTGRH